MIKKKLKSLLERIINKWKLPVDIYFGANYFIKLMNTYQEAFRRNGFNICYNRYIQRDYEPKKKNILLAIESPAVIEYHKWVKPEMRFIAEISFANYYNLKNYYCPRELYSANDFYVNLNTSRDYNKHSIVSMIYSKRQHLEGHKLRHEIANRFQNKIEIFGSGFQNEREKMGSSYYYPNTKKVRKIFSLKDYMFQIVIENGKYPEYVSEKFFDCLKTKTIPIYWGGEIAVRKMEFNPDGILFFDTIEDLNKLLDEDVSKETYNKKIKAIDYNFKRLIEIRNNMKLNFFLNTQLIRYFHSTESYHDKNYNAMAFDFD